MPVPEWLPPLNSHDNYTFSVTLSNDDEGFNYPSIESDMIWPEFLLFHVRTYVSFYPDNCDDEKEKQMSYICGLSLLNRLKISTTSISHDISNILTNRALIPFELPFERKGCSYVEWRVDTNQIEGQQYAYKYAIHTKDDLVECMTNYLRELYHDTIHSRMVPHRIFMVIKKVITLPKDESDSWNAWLDEQSNRRPRFDQEYYEAISRLRTRSELSCESTGKSSVDALENVVFDDSSKTCCVCLELLSSGEVGVKMLCLHEFHRACIIRWLKTSLMCPLCRHTLPTA